MYKMNSLASSLKVPFWSFKMSRQFGKEKKVKCLHLSPWKFESLASGKTHSAPECHELICKRG